MIDEDKIKQLLEAFYNGNTTLEEELLLKDFFNNKELNEKWHTEMNIFNALYNSSNNIISKEFSKRLEHSLDEHIKKEQIPSRGNIKKLFITIGSIAAATLFFTWMFFSKTHSSDRIADTYTNPEEAAIVAQEALILVSFNLNKGLTPLGKAQENIHTANQLLNKNIKFK